jgi:hypothetical protein
MEYEDDLIRVLLPGHTEATPCFEDVELSDAYEDNDDYLNSLFGVGGWQAYTAVPRYDYDWRASFVPKLKKVSFYKTI